MLRVLVGLIKGAIVGGGVGYGLLRIGWTEGVAAYVGCALVGALVGLVAGRAPWKSETLWTPLVKMVFGGLVGTGLAWVAFRVLPQHTFSLPQSFTGTTDGALGLLSAPVLAPIVGLIWGVFVEVDDGGDSKPAESAEKRPAKKSE